MNIVCCFKLVNDLDLVMEKDWLSASTSAVDLSYVKRIINCFDEAGLETALRIKDAAEKQGEKVLISAITVGDGNYEAFFKNLFAVGIDRILQLKVETNSPFAPDKISSLLCEAAKRCEYDAVITGMQSADGSNGLSPYLLAKKLEIPCISNVTELRYIKNGALRVSSDTGNGLRRATVGTCALFAIGNSVNPYLRMATLKRKLAVSQMTAEIIELADLSESIGKDAELCKLNRKKNERHCVFVQGETCDEKVENLLKAYPEVRKA